MRIGRLENGRKYRAMKIVLNTSPIIFLGKINCLHLLEQCANNIIAPKNVELELGDYALPDFIHVETLSMVGLAYVKGALGRLHEGELSAIVLAQELSADFVILDDWLARQKAQQLRLNVMGTLGLLLLMAKRQLLSHQQVWQHITELTQQHGMYLSPKIVGELKATLFAQDKSC
jgi:predicted nucleic acid-binding protein